MRILNCTSHNITESQKELGVIEPSNKDIILRMINFKSIDEVGDFKTRANAVLEEIKKNECNVAMIGGAPFFMPYLENYLLAHGIYVAYAFSKREAKERVLEDGTVEKISIFKSDTLIVKGDNSDIKIISK